MTPDATRSTPPDFTVTADPLATASDPNATGSHGSAPTSSVPFDTTLEELGRGAMGVVYKAIQPGLNRTVAVKMLLGEAADPRMALRFLAEAEAVAAIDHPHVVRVYEFGRRDGKPFLAMEYLPGGTLSDRLASGGRQPPVEAATLVHKLALGVAAAHAAGIVHRDLKPANVLFDAAGEPKVTDFGLAKRSTGADLTRTQAWMGTPAYMSPEQAKGEGKFVGPPADVWSLGVILYECLTGTRPFVAADTWALLQKVMSAEPASLRSLSGDVPRDLELIVAKCLRKDPAERYSTATELADDLRRYLAGEPILARPVGLAERGYKWAKQNPAVASLLAAVGLLLPAVVVGLLLADRFKAERDTAESAKAVAVRAERDRGRQLFRATLNAARARRASGQQGQRYENLAAIRQLSAALPADLLTADDLSDLRDEVVASLALPDVREIGPVWANGTAGFRDIDTDASLDVYASEDPVTGGTVIRRWSDPGREVRLPIPPPNLSLRSRALSPDGRRLVEVLHDPNEVNANRFRVWDARDGRPLMDKPLNVSRRSPAFHPAGDRLAVVVDETTIQVFDLPTGAKSGESVPHFRTAELHYSPDGNSLAVVNDGISEVVDARTWENQGVIDFPAAQAAVWNPNGRELALGNRLGQVYLWDREAKTGRILEGQHLRAVSSLHYTAAGRYLVSAALDERTFVRDPVRGSPRLTVAGRAIRLAADGRLAVSRDDHVYQYELTGVDGGTIRECYGQAEGVEFDPLGRWLAVAGPHGVALCPVETLRPDYDLGLDASGPPVFRPDGGELVTYGVFSHLLRWPVTATDGTVRVGPPAPGMPPLSVYQAAGVTEEPQREGRHAAWSRDGRTLAWGDDRKGRVFVADATTEKGLVLATLKAVRVAVSPDGALVAATVRGGGVHVLRVADGTTARTLSGYTSAAFSPDGRWLVTASPRLYQFWRTDTWEPAHTVPCEDAGIADPPIAFDRDGRLVALPVSMQKLRLVRADTGTTLVTLTNSEPMRVVGLSFHPAGDRLAVARAGHNAVVWNLAGLHAALTDLGLAWDKAETPFNSAPPAAPPPVRIDRGPKLPAPGGWYAKWMTLARGEVQHGRFADAIDNVNGALAVLPADAVADRARLLAARGGYYLKSNNPWAARADWRQALALAPDLEEPAKGLARLMVLGPPDLRDPLRGLQQAVANVERDREDTANQLVLGAAYMMNGQHQRALDALAKVPETRRGPLDGYLRTICRHHLGDPAAASVELAAATAAHDRTTANLKPYQADELRRLRTDAEQVVRPTRPRQ